MVRILLTVLLALLFMGPLRAEEVPGVRVPPGFTVTLYAGPDLAPDLYSMTLDARGRVVVSSQGWVKTLHEGKTPGRAERATIFAETKTGGMGLCFDGDDLLFCGDGWLSRYCDADGDGRADGPPEKLLPFRFNDHGGHAVRKGPDGWWYVVGGNDSPLGAKHVTRPRSPVRTPEAGGIVRMPPDLKSCEVVAHGFRNPYDFDFNPFGDLFTYDSDTERDYLLPWYSPTRLYHVAHAGHHGWRVPGYMRSWARPGYQPDGIEALAPIGRGSPCGVVCYRHRHFPDRFHGGLFFLDWTFGRVYFTPLTPDGSTYTAKPEVFLESTGSTGFAPTDVVVAPDGALLICIGGRRTRGSIYRVEFVEDRDVSRQVAERREPPGGSRHEAPDGSRRTAIDAVLDAPQPLDAWSRAHWIPLAKKLGAAPFAAALANETLLEAARVRAAEVLTELFDGLPAEAARAGSRSKSSLVRARVAWSLGRAPCSDAGAILMRLAGDDNPRVRLAALDAIGDRIPDQDADALRPAVLAGLGHADKRLRQAAARIATHLPDSAWKHVQTDAANGSTQTRLSTVMAGLWREPPQAAHEGAINESLTLFAKSSDAGIRLQALRLMVLALGDYNLNAPPAEVFTGYSAPFKLVEGELRARVLQAVRAEFPSGSEVLDDELARLLAMLEDEDAETVRKVARFWTDASSATRDLHFLVVLGRLRGKWDDATTVKIADAVLSLHHKLKGSEQRVKQNWGDRLTEVVRALLSQEPRLAKELLRHPRFAQPGHVSLALVLNGPVAVRREPPGAGATDAPPDAPPDGSRRSATSARSEAAGLFLKAARDPDEFGWSSQLIELLSSLPMEQLRPILRDRWDSLDLRDAILRQLAKQPEVVDREKFLTGLESFSPPAVKTALSALEQLPADPTPENLVPLLRLLRQLCRDPADAKTRFGVITLLERQTGQKFTITEGKIDAKELPRLYQPVLDWFAKTYPNLAAKVSGDDLVADLTVWKKVLTTVAWEKGDARRGEKLFQSRSCLACHAGASRVAPDLTGAATRFSRDDLFTAIIAPSRDVAPAYRATTIETVEGHVHTGIMVFQAADGVILVTGPDTSVRIPTESIESRRLVARSPMPEGLLKDLRPQDLADLYSYIQTLTPPVKKE